MDFSSYPRPPRRWLLQTSAAFAGALALLLGATGIAVTGGLPFDFAPPAAATARHAAAYELDQGQYYEDQWINPRTSRPYADDIDAQTVAFADAGEAMAAEPLAGANDQPTWDEPVWSEPVAADDSAYDDESVLPLNEKVPYGDEGVPYSELPADPRADAVL